MEAGDQLEYVIAADSHGGSECVGKCQAGIWLPAVWFIPQHGLR